MLESISCRVDITHQRDSTSEVTRGAQILASGEAKHIRLIYRVRLGFRPKRRVIILTQSSALLSCAQTSGHARGVTARLDRNPDISSAMKSVFVVEEHEIQPDARDLYAPVFKARVRHSYENWEAKIP